MAKRSRLVAVVTGANRGIGLELVKQLAQLRLPAQQGYYGYGDDDHAHAEDEGGAGGGEGEAGAAEQGNGHRLELKMEVVMTARNPELGREAAASLSSNSTHNDGYADYISTNNDGYGDYKNIHFHQLDVTCPHSISAFVSWLHLRFGRLDILINNAAVLGATLDIEYIQTNNLTAPEIKASALHQAKAIRSNLDQQRNCIETNYFGVKRMIQAMLPLLSKSKKGSRIINISSSAGKLENLPNKALQKKLSQVETLDEKDVDDFVQKFLEDVNNGSLPSDLEEIDFESPSLSWPLVLPGYRVSKIALNAYTRVLSRNLLKQGKHDITVNVVHPGFVKTEMVSNMGEFSIIEATQDIIWLTMLPHPHPSGQFFFQKKPYEF